MYKKFKTIDIDKKVKNMSDSDFVNGISKTLVDMLSIIRVGHSFTVNTKDCVTNLNYANRISAYEADNLFGSEVELEKEYAALEKQVLSLYEDVKGALLEEGIKEDLSERFSDREELYTEEFFGKMCEKVNINNLNKAAFKFKRYIDQKADAVSVFLEKIITCHGVDSKYGRVLDNVGFIGTIEDINEIMQEKAADLVVGVRESLLKDDGACGYAPEDE